MAIHSLQHTQPATQQTILIAGTDDGQRTFHTEQLDADGHTIHDADHAAAVIAKLSSHAIDVLILGELEKPFETTALVRSVRAGRHPRVHPRGSRSSRSARATTSARCAPTRVAATTTSQPARATSCSGPSSHP